MPKLYFRHGTMNSSKTANLLMVHHNYKTQGKRVVLLKPEIDTRYGDSIIKSRTGMEIDADIIVRSDTDIYQEIEKYMIEPLDCVLVDECQFLKPHHIDILRDLTEHFPVVCYGLRTDYMTNLFPGSKRLMEIADTIEEIKTTCVDCNKKAIINAKFVVENGEKIIVRYGNSEPDLGAEEKYQPMCFDCWAEL